MPATPQSPLTHRLTRRLTRAVFWSISLFKKPTTEGLPWQVKTILKILQLAEGDGPPPPQKMRKLYRLLTIPYHVSTPRMAEVQDYDIPDGPTLRLYRPQYIEEGGPALLYIHGGGGVIGDLETHDPLCRYLAAEAGMVVVALDYRLNPEHKSPAQIEDALAAYNWVRENAHMLGIDPARIGAGGDSAGAYLSLLLSRKTGLEDGLKFLWLVYPFTDMAADTASRREFTEGLILTTPVMEYFTSHAVGGEPLPSLAEEDFATSPPVLLVTAGFDPLRDEGVALAARMDATGGKVTHLHYPRLLHEFVSMGGVVPEARAALDEAISGLKAMVEV